MLGSKLEAQVAINSSGNDPDNSAMLEIAATDKGLLIPRLTQAQRDAIPFPATGLLIYQKSGAQGFYYYNGAAWLPLLGGNGAFVSVSGLTTSINPNDDFLFGAATINNVASGERKFFFHKNTGAFRAGTVNTDVWDTSNLGESSFAGGLGTKATAKGSTAFGGSCRASGEYAFAAGSFSIASGEKSVAMGRDAEAIGDQSVALGAFSRAIGRYSLASNYVSDAEGDYSTAIGRYAIAKSYAEVAIGAYNTNTGGSPTNWNTSDRIFVIGNGTNSNNRKNAFTVFKDGTVAVGNITHGDIKGKLHVDGGVSTYFSSYAYLNYLGDVNTIGNQTNPYSIYATNRIACSEFNAFSDARIKRVLGQSDAVEDLGTLSKIRITDYKMIDHYAHGDKTYKKVIAQEVAAVYPKAVNKSKEFIPNIFKRSKVENGWIPLMTDLKVGDKVKIITPQKQLYLEVLQAEKHRFQVALDDVANILVYGKEVDDFHSVDYDALTTLNISATQALLQRIATLEKENTRLKTLEANYKTLSAEVEAIKALLQPTN